MATTTQVEAPRLKVAVAQELESDAAAAVAQWLRSHAPAEIVQCFSGMRELSTYIMETHDLDGNVSSRMNETILHSLGSVVNALSELKHR